MPDVKLEEFISAVEEKNPNQSEFLQSVRDVMAHVFPFVQEHERYGEQALLERLVDPDRIISFKVCWEDDNGDVQVNRGYRVQFNNAIGPYKGGLRFHPSVNVSILKFLGFEQTFKNALTGLPMGGGKGGSDFNPDGRSEREIMRFCKAFMQELVHHIDPEVDVPAGDINVGEREIGFLFGAYKAITNHYEGVLTGKGLSYGGSQMRTEATGHGVVLFLKHMLEKADEEISGKNVVISGAGNVALHAAAKIIDLGGNVISLSDSSGFIHDADGLDTEKLDWIKELKSKHGTSLEEYADEYGVDWHADKTPWGVNCDIALPCATQNEIGKDGAKSLADNECMAIVEGANMPVDEEGKMVIKENGILFGPAKAANAGGVAVSGLEISQNRDRLSWDREAVQEKLEAIMAEIHERCVDVVDEKEGEVIDYAKAANIAGFKQVADAMLAQGF